MMPVDLGDGMSQTQPPSDSASGREWSLSELLTQRAPRHVFRHQERPVGTSEPPGNHRRIELVNDIDERRQMAAV